MGTLGSSSVGPHLLQKKPLLLIRVHQDPLLKISHSSLTCLQSGDMWLAKKTLNSTKIAWSCYTQYIYLGCVIIWSPQRAQEPYSKGNLGGLFSLCESLLKRVGSNLTEKKLELQFNSGMIMWLKGQNKNLQYYFLFKVHLARLHKTL